MVRALLVLAALGVAVAKPSALRARGGEAYAPDWYPGKVPPAEGSALLPFEYLEKFMIATFQSLGVPEEEAATCADVPRPSGSMLDRCDTRRLSGRAPRRAPRRFEPPVKRAASLGTRVEESNAPL